MTAQSKAYTGVSAGPLKIEGLVHLVSHAGAEQFSPPVGRKRELDQLKQILSRRTKNSAVLLGEPGVGNILLFAVLRSASAKAVCRLT